MPNLNLTKFDMWRETHNRLPYELRVEDTEKLNIELENVVKSIYAENITLKLRMFSSLAEAELNPAISRDSLLLKQVIESHHSGSCRRLFVAEFGSIKKLRAALMGVAETLGNNE